MRIPLVAAAILFMLPACDTLAGLDSFDVPVEAQTVIPGSPLGGAIDLVDQELPFPGLTSLDFTDERAFKENGISKNDIDSMKLSTMRLSVTAPENGNLDFFDKIEMFVESPGQERRKIAEKQQIPDGVSEIALDTLDVELKPYVEDLTLTTIVSGRPPRVDTTVKVRAVFEVNAAIL